MPKFAKGSQEAKDWGAKMKAARAAAKADPNRPQKAPKPKEMVKLPIVGADELVVPEYMGNVSGKKMRLVKPLTKERYLAKRDGKPVVRLSRRPVKTGELISGGTEEVDINKFSKADRAKIRKTFISIADYDKRPLADKPIIKESAPIERGRGQVLYKNAEYWAKMPYEDYQLSKAMIKFSKPELIPIIERIRKFREKQGMDEEDEGDFPDDDDDEGYPDEEDDEEDDEEEDDDEPKPKGKRGRKPKEDYSNIELGFDRSGKQRTLKQELAHRRRKARLDKASEDAGKGKTKTYNPKKAQEAKKGGAKQNITMTIQEMDDEEIELPEPQPAPEKSNIENLLTKMTEIADANDVKFYNPYGFLSELILIDLAVKYGNSCIWLNRPEIYGFSDETQLRKEGVIEPYSALSGFSDTKLSIVYSSVKANEPSEGHTPILNPKYIKALENHLDDCLRRGVDLIVFPIGLKSRMLKTKAELDAEYQKEVDEFRDDILDQRPTLNAKEATKIAKKYFAPKYGKTGSKISPSVAYKSDSGHYNLLIIRPNVKQLELYEPHGARLGLSSRETGGSDVILEVIKKAFIDKMKIFKGYKLQSPSDICPPNQPKGFQALENRMIGAAGYSGKELEDLGGGFCALWSAFVAELIFSNPNSSTVDIMDEALRVAKSEPEYLLRVIKGYVFEAEQRIRMLFKNLGVQEANDWSYEKSKSEMTGDNTYGISLDTKKKLWLWVRDIIFNQNRIIKTVDKQGKGILDNITKAFKGAVKTVDRGIKKGVDMVKDKVEDNIDFYKTVIKGRMDYQPKGRDILKRYGGEKIKAIELGREPVMAALKGVLNLISGGKFGKRVDKSFDDLFHLFCVITLDSGKKIMTEKNEVIIISESIPSRGEKAEYRMVTDIPYADTDPITLQTLFDNAREKMGDKRFFQYSAKDNNCQDYLLALLKFSDIGTPEDYEWIKQDTKSLFKDLPYLRKFANSVTDFAGKLDVIMSGRGLSFSGDSGGIPKSETEAIEEDDGMDEQDQMYGEGLIGSDYEVQSVIFDKDKYKIPAARKWLKENKYISPKVDIKENFYRFRQLDPQDLEEKGYDAFRNKKLGDSGIQLVIAYKNKIYGNGIKKMSHKCEMCGGKISLKDIGRSFKKLGKKIDTGFKKEISRPTEKLAKEAGKYITAKKGGLATDLIDYGVPAATAALAGAAAGAATGGLGGVIGSAAGSKLGKEVIAPALHKATGAGVKGGRSAWIDFVKKVAADKGISYKEALSVASKMKR
jgi:hypothetical protein